MYADITRVHGAPAVVGQAIEPRGRALRQLIALALLVLLMLSTFGCRAREQPSAPTKKSSSLAATTGGATSGAPVPLSRPVPPPASGAERSRSGTAGPKQPSDPSVTDAGPTDASITRDPPAAPKPEAGIDLDQPAGRCRDPKFRKLAATLVVTCAPTSIYDTSPPVVRLTEEQFEALFAQNDDAGVATHFAIFGCTRYISGRKGCIGYNSYYADPVEVDKDYDAGTLNRKERDNARQYSTVIKREFRKWFLHNSMVRYLVFLGNASPLGNRNEKMSPRSKVIALERARRVRALAEETRTDAMAGMESFVVVLNNAVRDFIRPRFRDMVMSRILAPGVEERGFTPTGNNAINRSVMAVAISCDLDEELRELRGK